MGNNWDTSAELIKSVNIVVAWIKAHVKQLEISKICEN